MSPKLFVRKSPSDSASIQMKFTYKSLTVLTSRADRHQLIVVSPPVLVQVCHHGREHGHDGDDGDAGDQLGVMFSFHD